MPSAHSVRTPRNVVVIMTDQHRADVCAREGFALDTTPHLDALAGEGAWFDHGYTSSPLCCPARTSLLTGRFPAAHRVTTNPAMRLAVADDDLFSTARALGCATALIGKNHTWVTKDDVDTFVEFMHGGQISGPRTDAEAEFDTWLSGLRHRTTTEPTPFPVELQNPVRIVDHAQDWISSLEPDQPFALLLSFPEPHNPFQAPEPYFSQFPVADLPPTDTDATALEDAPFSWRYLHALGRAGHEDYDGRVPRARASYFGMLRLIDEQVRRFTDFLDERHLRQDTLIVITSDHGDYVGEYGLVRKGAELPEVLTRVPLLITGPSIVAHQGPRPEHVSLVDIYPTICDALGAPIAPGVQGRSLWPLLTGTDDDRGEFRSAYVEQGMGGLPYTADDVPDPMPGLQDNGGRHAPSFDELNAVTQSGRRRMVRKDRWKIVADELGSVRLYDLETDPRELRDLTGEAGHAEVLVDLLTELASWMMRAEDPLPVPERGYQLKTDPRNHRAPYRTQRTT
jgi:arylsulfatase A-like enzyme